MNGQVSTRGNCTSSKYLRESIRRDQERQRLRDMLLKGAASPRAAPADADYFDRIRNRIRETGRG